MSLFKKKNDPKRYEEQAYEVFSLFNKKWALVTAGSLDDYNTCTIGWGMLGNIWENLSLSIFIHPSRYTSEFLKRNDAFTVSFYPKECAQALAYLGSHSGRDGDKVKEAGLTPIAMGDSVTFKQAEFTFLCRKIYLHQFSKDGLDSSIRKYYSSFPEDYPNVTPDGTSDNWEPHYAIIGEIVDVLDKR